MTYDATTYQTIEGLLVWYSQEHFTTTTRQGATTSLVKVTRHATKRYAFRNLSEYYANQCVNAKKAQYLRNYYDAIVSNGVIDNNRIVLQRTTDITMSKNEAYTFNVEISVNETDSQIASPSSGYNYVTNPEALFTSIVAGRDYDENIMTSKTTQGLSMYSQRNRKTDSELDVKYRVELLNLDLPRYVYTRYAKKRLAYIGMNQSAAEICAKAKLAQYCREYSRVWYDTYGYPNDVKSIGNGASVSLLHNGPLWDVVVDINETDTKHQNTRISPDIVFSSENGRYYDADRGDFIFTSASVTRVDTSNVSILVKAHLDISEYEFSDIITYYNTTDEASLVWHQATTAPWSVSGTNGSTTFSINHPGGAQIYLKLKVGDFESDMYIETIPS